MDLNDVEDDILNDFLDNAFETSKLENEHRIIKPSDPTPEHLSVLSKHFGHKSFRPLQWQIISSIMYDKRDVCAIMSTGYGKSLTFQYPSVFLGGVTLVISPLISLMEDQILSLKVSNIPACLLGTAQQNQKQVIENIFSNKYKLVYLTPEFCTGDFGQDILRRMSNEISVTLIAIDEAHCISSWGHDFRHQYRHLQILRNIFKNVPIIAVTATATQKVQQDIVRSLNLRNPLFVSSGFDRPNIYLEVYSKSSDVYNDMTKVMVRDKTGWKFSGPTIVYCITRKEAEDVAFILKSNCINCRVYHAGLPLKERKDAHELFVKDRIDVIVATIAFGMGIDKPDIRNVVHYGCSSCIESYYQEIGRAGRDGLPSTAVTFYNPSDLLKHRNLIAMSGLKERKDSGLMKMEEYLTTAKCRRVFILEYFSDNVENFNKPRSSCCDNCTKKLTDSRSDCDKYEGIDANGCFDFTEHAQKFLKVVIFLYKDYGFLTYVRFLRGLNCPKIPEAKMKNPLYGCGKEQTENWWKAIGRFLIQLKYLDEKSRKTFQGFNYTTIDVTETGKKFVENSEKLIIQPPSTILSLLKKKAAINQWIPTGPANSSISATPSTSKTDESSESPLELKERMALYHKLINKRGEIASHLDCMPYMVASNAALMTMSKLKPKNLDDLQQLNLDGFAEAKINKFGNKFLSVIIESQSQCLQKENKKLSIKEALNLHPLSDINFTATHQVTFALYQSGLTVGEIAAKRGVMLGTIISHLISGLKYGLPIKLIDIGVDEETRDHIITVYRKFCKTGFLSVKLSEIKDQCSDDITYDQIKAVLAYLQIRTHLQNLKIEYEEFEDFSFIDVKLESQDENFENGYCEIPAKKFKSDCDEQNEAGFNAVLASPPRENIQEIEETIKIEPNLVESVNSIPNSKKNLKTSKTKVLPPWLVVKKIN